jgi:hypothetical protein
MKRKKGSTRSQRRTIQWVFRHPYWDWTKANRHQRIQASIQAVAILGEQVLAAIIEQIVPHDHPNPDMRLIFNSVSLPWGVGQGLSRLFRQRFETALFLFWTPAQFRKLMWYDITRKS